MAYVNNFCCPVNLLCSLLFVVLVYSICFVTPFFTNRSANESHYLHYCAPPPASAAAAPPALAPADATAAAASTSPPPSAFSRVAKRGRARPKLKALPTRNSSRLAGKAPAVYVHATDKATQRRALKDSLQACSQAVKTQVQKGKLLTKNKLPTPVPALRKLVQAAGLGCRAADSVGVVPPVAE